MVSIIMPAYNCAEFIADSIASVTSQTYKKWELIIVDDCSSDNTLKICSAYAMEDDRIKVHHLPQNAGPAKARNFAIDLARGQYIAFLDSDDLWAPEKLEIQIFAMENNNVALCFSSYKHVDENGAMLATVTAPKSTTYRRMLLGSHIGCLTVVYNTKVIGKKYFIENTDLVLGSFYKLFLNTLGHEDYILWLSILKECEQNNLGINSTLGIPQILASYRLRKNSFSAHKIKVALYQWIIYRKCENLNLFSSAYYFINYVARGIKKHRTNQQ